MVLEFVNPFDKAIKGYSDDVESFLICCTSEKMVVEFKIVCNRLNPLMPGGNKKVTHT